MKILNITYPDINNGLGCRVTLWISGCTHKCKGCQNECSWSYNIGETFTTETYKKIYNILKLPYISGLTLSGGDPLNQSEEVLNEILNLVKKLKTDFPNKNIWVYTGFTYNELKGLQLEILKYCDILVDGRFINSKKDITLAFRGSTNQNIINLKTNQIINNLY